MLTHPPIPWWPLYPFLPTVGALAFFYAGLDEIKSLDRSTGELQKLQKSHRALP